MKDEFKKKRRGKIIAFLIIVLLLVGALFFSVVIGMIAGAIPAWNASRMKPVDALRYE